MLAVAKKRVLGLENILKANQFVVAKVIFNSFCTKDSVLLTLASINSLLVATSSTRCLSSWNPLSIAPILYWPFVSQSIYNRNEGSHTRDRIKGVQIITLDYGGTMQNFEGRQPPYGSNSLTNHSPVAALRLNPSLYFYRQNVLFL